ncbi:MAG: DMT family transporter [Deltaproteobacteria bacterium]|nr:DMT family transporter [Deltaproteobacteria bacterium]
MTRQQEQLGLLFAALCAVNGAFVPALAKLTTGRAEPLFVAAMTSAFAGLCAVVVLSVQGKVTVLVRRTVGPRLLLVGALGTAGAHLLFFLGARRASAIETVLCLQTEPAYSLLLAWLALGHRPSRRRLAATAMLLLGIALAVGGVGAAPSSGVWILLATPLCWQLSHLVVLRGLAGVSPSVLTGARYINGSVLLALAWLASGGVSSLPAATELLRQLPLLAVQGVVLSYAGTLAWYQAIARLDLARTTAIVVPSIPLLSLAASFLLLGEVPTAQQWIGLLLTAAGVLVFVTAPHVAAADRPLAAELF